MSNHIFPVRIVVKKKQQNPIFYIINKEVFGIELKNDAPFYFNCHRGKHIESSIEATDWSVSKVNVFIIIWKLSVQYSVMP